MIVDVHAHYFPARYFELLGRPVRLPPSAVLGTQNIQERLEILDTLGIDVQLLSIGNGQPYLPSARAGRDATLMLNDSLIELCNQYPGRFRVLASLPLPHAEASLAEIDRLSSIDTVVGFTFGCSVGDRQLDDEIFAPIYGELDDRGAVVLLHPVAGLTGTWLGDYNLAWLVGAPVEDTVAALRLVLSGTTRRHPGVRFVVPHLGGTVPFLVARMARISRRPDLADELRRLYFDTVSGSTASLRCACAALGPDRLLFGTDYPYCDVEEFTCHLRYLSDAGLDQRLVDRIAGQLAADLFGLGPSRAPAAGEPDRAPSGR